MTDRRADDKDLDQLVDVVSVPIIPAFCSRYVCVCVYTCVGGVCVHMGSALSLPCGYQ